MEDDFGVRYHFNKIKNLNKISPVLIQIHNVDEEESEQIYIPTNF
jgi:hypothetical protein